MAKQVQLRRGTTAEHENFIGAPGEVTVDTDMHTLHVHDGTTPGGHVVGGGTDNGGTSLPANMDYVIEWQTPTAENGYTWYRKYAYGWVEQGGIIPVKTTSVTLPVPLTDANYTVFLAYRNTATNTSNVTMNSAYSQSQTNTSFTVISSDHTLKGWFISYMGA